jgi:hypothetical protein
MQLTHIHRRSSSSDNPNPKLMNAAAGGSSSSSNNNFSMQGSPVVAVSKPYNWIDRKVDAPKISDKRKIPVVLSSIVALSRFCFAGYDAVIKPVDESDDTPSTASKIDAALKQFKLIDKNIGRVGKSKKVGFLGLVRRTFLDTTSFRSSVFEFSQKSAKGWNGPAEIQNIPSMSIYRQPGSLMDPDKYIVDYILKGILYDTSTDKTRFFQAKKSFDEPVELNSDQILHIEDQSVPEDSSMVGSIVPSIEQWQTMRKNLMIGMHRGMAAPNMVARIDAADLARAKEAGVGIVLSDLVAYAKALVENQGSDIAQMAWPGLKLEYPSVSLPVNPTDPDKFLQQEIVSHFFQRNITEQLAAAVSTTSEPAKAVIDALVGSYRETNGKPWETFINSTILEPNGFADFEFEFTWWDYTPKDQQLIVNNATQQFNSGGLLINDYRKKLGDEPYSPEEISQLIAEHQALRAAKPPAFGGSQTEPSQIPQMQSAPKLLNISEDPLQRLLDEKVKIAEKAIKEVYPEFFKTENQDQKA